MSEASRILKTPETTLRRMILEGKIVGEREQRAPGDPRTVWRVRVDLPDDPPTPATAPESPATNEPATEPPAAITGLLELIAADRATIAGLYAEQASLRERVGRAEERATVAEAERERLLAKLEHARRPWWQKLLGRYPAP